MRRIFPLVFLFFGAFSIYASDLDVKLGKILPASVVTEIEEKGTLQNIVFNQKNTLPRFAPDTQEARNALSFWNGRDSLLFIETLYLYKKTPRNTASRSSEAEKISGILRSLSKLKGIEYYSNSRKKMRILYEKSYVVDNPSSRNRIEDPVQGSANGLSVYAVQKDSTFGEFLYKYSYAQTENTVSFFSSNVDAINFFFIKVIDPDKLRISLVVQDLGDYLLAYSVIRTDFLDLPAFQGKISASISSRAEAVYTWFIKEYEKQ